MSFPTVAATNGGNSGADTYNHTVNLPTGIVSGSLVLVLLTTDGNVSFTWPGGWTQLFNAKANANRATLGVAYRVCDGGEGSTITVDTSGYEASAHTTYRIEGYSGTPEFGTAAARASTEPDPPSLSPSWGAADTLWIAVCGRDTNVYPRSILTYPENYTNGIFNFWDNTNGAGTASAQRELNTATEDPGVFTFSSSDDWAANTIAVQPITGGETCTMPAGGGSYILSGTAAGVRAGRKVGAGSGSYALSGADTTALLLARMLAASEGIYSLTGTTTPLIADRVILADSGTYALAGTGAALLLVRRILASTGSYSLTGTEASLIADRMITAASGSYALTGSAANLVKSGGATLSVDSGTYLISGSDAGLLVARVLATSGGTYAVSGSGVGLIKDSIVPILAGTYTITGSPATLLLSRKLGIGSGAYTIIGGSVGLIEDSVIISSPGSYLLTGKPVILQYSGAPEEEGGAGKHHRRISDSVTALSKLGRLTVPLVICKEILEKLN